jgi:hypothetical protein
LDGCGKHGLERLESCGNENLYGKEVYGREHGYMLYDVGLHIITKGAKNKSFSNDARNSENKHCNCKKCYNIEMVNSQRNFTNIIKLF